MGDFGEIRIKYNDLTHKLEFWKISPPQLIATFGSFGLESEITIKHVSTPPNPSSGYSCIYVKSDGNVYAINSTGTEVMLGASVPPDGIRYVSSEWRHRDAGGGLLLLEHFNGTGWDIVGKERA